MASELEDANVLRLGPEFESETCMSNAEVSIMLQEAKERYEKEDKAVPEVFEQTLNFVNRFAQVKDPVANKAVVEELSLELDSLRWHKADEAADGGVKEVQLAQYEVAALMNLRPEDYDEAVAIVPSLQHKLTEAEITIVLDKIARSDRVHLV